MVEYKRLLDQLLPPVKEAGSVIMDVYQSLSGYKNKADGSPVTEADNAAEAILSKALKKVAPDIPVISEENPESHKLKAPNTFFLVDPLDGTRDFISGDGKGSFTVNIGLIENNVPTFGIVFAPAHNRMFYALPGVGAYEGEKPITVRQVEPSQRIAFTSLLHKDPTTAQWLLDNHIMNTVGIGSSFKFGLLANGEADVYPRFSPTMEWDTAAGHAILSAAGGHVTNPDGTPFLYGKPGYLNGDFIASAYII